MSGHVDRLLHAASEPIGPEAPGDHGMAEFLGEWGRLGLELGELLSRKNGFYAMESALLVRPFGGGGKPIDLAEWNRPGLWKQSYDGDVSGALFFAEDVFGFQFALRGERVWAFDPETAGFEELGRSLEDWAGLILRDYQLRTGYPLAHGWQANHGPLVPGRRLAPKVPFVLGGEFTLDNLAEADELETMRFRAELARKIRDLPNGTEIRLDVVD